jgi:hypothetical protein
MSIAESQRAVIVPSLDELVRNQVRHLLQRSTGELVFHERRQDRRFPFPALMTLYSADAPKSAPPLVVVGKDISDRGLGFFHQYPIHFRRAVVVCDGPSGAQVGFLVDISWCRFTRQGWYESGCRLLEAVAPPFLQHVPADLV